MATIICIETSGKTCSVALSVDGEVAGHWEDSVEMNHASALAPLVEEALKILAHREIHLDAVAVSIGPGSYTGLRIGLSFAKGLCFSKAIPLIGIPTLKILAVKGLFSMWDIEGDEYIIPMIDARRMEVYTAVYDLRLQPVEEAAPLILQPDSFATLKGKKLCFAGDGSAKAKDVLDLPDARWLSAAPPHAVSMPALAEKAYREHDFIDTAYSVPLYLKEYEAKKSSNRVLLKARSKN